MKKIALFLLLPIILLAKFQVTTYFPLETYIAKYIGKKQIRVKQINNRYLAEKREISEFELSKLADVKTYIYLGLDPEKHYIEIFKKYNPYIRILDLSKNVKLMNDNPYYWMDPFNLRVVAKNIYEEFCSIDRYNCHFYKKNYDLFLGEIDKTFLIIKNKLLNSEVQNLYVMGNYWDYFAKRFRLRLHDRKKDHIKADELNNFLKETQEKNILKLIYLMGDSYELASAISNSVGIGLIEHDPFEEKIFFNLKLLSQEISK